MYSFLGENPGNLQIEGKMHLNPFYDDFPQNDERFAIANILKLLLHIISRIKFVQKMWQAKF